jgi:hypothetical protein
MVAPIGYVNVEPKATALNPEVAPVWLWGVGTPDGDASPWLEANKGSLYSNVDATDDASHIYQKVDEGGDDADWVLVALPV